MYLGQSKWLVEAFRDAAVEPFSRMLIDLKPKTDEKLSANQYTHPRNSATSPDKKDSIGASPPKTTCYRICLLWTDKESEILNATFQQMLGGNDGNWYLKLTSTSRSLDVLPQLVSAYNISTNVRVQNESEIYKRLYLTLCSYGATESKRGLKV